MPTVRSNCAFVAPPSTATANPCMISAASAPTMWQPSTTSLARHHCDRVSEADVVSLVNAGYSQAQAYGLFAYLVERCRAK